MNKLSKLGELFECSIRSRIVKASLVAFLLFGICFEGHAQQETPAPSVADFTEENYQIFRNFYYDSFQTVFTIVGDEILTLSSETFQKLPLESQYNVCIVHLDYFLFRHMLLESLFEVFEGQHLGRLNLRLMADLVGVPWNSSADFSEDEKQQTRQRIKEFKDELALKGKYFIEKENYCFDDARLVKEPGTYKFIEGYASVPMEFQMRDLYRSQVPFVQWIQENMPESTDNDG